MGSVRLQWEGEGTKQAEKEANKGRSLNLCFFFFFSLFSHAVSTYIKQIIILVLLVTNVSSDVGRWVK